MDVVLIVHAFGWWEREVGGEGGGGRELKINLLYRIVVEQKRGTPHVSSISVHYFFSLCHRR